MSEQTPNSQDGVQDSSLSGDEPSMEDILASIRKIISEDEPVAMESPEDSFVELKSDSELNVKDADDDLASMLNDMTETVTEPEIAQPASDVVDLDLDSVLAELDNSVTPDADMAKQAVAGTVGTLGTVDANDDDILAMLDMEIPMEEDGVEDLLSENIDELLEPAIELTPIAEVEATPLADIDTDDDLEMDALLDDILLTSDADMDLDLPEQATVDNDPDLELVKSLMADLADDGAVEFETDDDLDALLAIPEIDPVEETDLAENVEPVQDIETLEDILEADEPVESVEETPILETETEAEAELEAPEEDILGDILDMTLEDELQSHPDDLSDLLDVPSADDIAVDELANADLNELADLVEEVEVADELPSLADIAAAAVVDDVPRETVELTTEELVNTPKEAHMPVKAVNTDAILDEVTETAAVGAFAELNAVVEEKAVFNERGPRIGDLVQEALRPMLKDWLDENLKGIVERAVAKEVKRISSGK